MSERSRKSVVLWSGGKDSCLALHEAHLLGYEVLSLVTFTPREPEFLAHPLELIRLQAQALGIPSQILEVREPFKFSYVRAINRLAETYGIDTLITGDIAQVDGRANWIRECTAFSRVTVVTPLWGRDGIDLLNRLLSCRFRAVFSCVRKPFLTPEWLGRELDKGSLEKLAALSAENGFSVSGEHGEYHTVVVDGPLFLKAIRRDSYSKQTKGPLAYVSIERMSLVDK